MKRKLTTLTLSCVIALCLVLLLNFKDTRALISNTPVQNVDALCKPYTDSDTLYNFAYQGVTKTIQDYLNLRNNFQYVQNADDPITAIVPKELFMARGEYYHFGKEYGFYVHTRQVNQQGDSASIKPSLYSNLVTVFLFDITITPNELSDNCTFKVSPLFCYDYAYIVPQAFYGSQIFYYWQPFYSDWNYGEIVKYQSRGFLANGKTDIVISINDGRYYNSYDGDHYDESWQMNGRYMIQNIALSQQLSNVNHANKTDVGYNVNIDNGSFFAQSVMKYKGSYMYTPTDITFLTIAMGFADIVGDAFGVFELLTNIVGNVYTNGSPSTYSYRDQISGPAESEYTFQEYKNSKYGQINQYGQLLRTAGMSFVNADDCLNPIIYKPIFTDAESNRPSFSLINKIGSTSEWKTKIESFCQFTLIFRGGSSSFGVRTIGQKTLKCGDAVYMYNN